MQKRWVIQMPEAMEKVETLGGLLGTPTALTSILVYRSIETFEQAQRFFRPSLTELHDPFLMQDMERAATRLNKALEKRENILIYGDYDVDGTTAVAMVYTFLKKLPGTKVWYYVPDRLSEGYGISIQAIEKAHQANVKLIIALDCGIKAYAAIDRAVVLGIDVIVCDHHEVGDILPKAYAILDPKRSDCLYPFKELSGCGIGFKLLQAFCKKNGFNDVCIYPYLDLVAVSTVCDIVPLVGENRILTYHGIKRLETKPCPGLRALMDLAFLAKPITVADLIFKVGPRINVAGRISHAALTIQLLIAQNIEQAYDLAQVINQQNQLRKELDYTTTQEALSRIEAHTTLASQKSHVLFQETWHKGIVGIVAARCIEKYYRPTVILTCSNGQATGSARSVAGYNVYQAITACSALLHQYGGHAAAAGLSMPLEKVAAFQEKFERVVSATISPYQLIPRQPIHALIPLQAITQKFVNILKQMAPFGVGNPTPVFASKEVYAYSYTLLKGQHLKLELYQRDCTQRYSAIAFGLAHQAPLVANGHPFSLAYTIDYNPYLRDKPIQLMVKDIQAEKSINEINEVNIQSEIVKSIACTLPT